jgi:hypothetical protein
MAAIALGGSIAILVAAGILAFVNFVSDEQRRNIAGIFKARAKRSLRWRPRRLTHGEQTAESQRRARHISREHSFAGLKSPRGASSRAEGTSM